uniref:Uncharacterized protein n=1 Tax=Anopheles farauti TaxID=69004 RepID=A0A182QUD3_9DIPT
MADLTRNEWLSVRWRLRFRPCGISKRRVNDLGGHTDERDAIQKKTFTKWVNKHLKKIRAVAATLDDHFACRLAPVRPVRVILGHREYESCALLDILSIRTEAAKPC